MAHLEIVAPGGAHAVAAEAKSLWIVAEPWKTQKARFPPLVGRAKNARPHAPQGPIVFRIKRDKHDGRIGLQQGRRCSILMALA
jgi:hypothetical protein